MMIEGSHVGEDVAEQHPRPPHAQRRRRVRILALLHRQDLPRTTRAYTTQPAADRLMMMLRSPSPTMALMVMREEDEGKGELHVRQPHDHRPRPAAEVAGEEAERRRPPPR